MHRIRYVCFLILGCACLSAAAVSDVAAKKKDDAKKKMPPILEKSGELKKSDEKDPKTKAPRQVFPIVLTEGKKYQIDLTSPDFDAYLRLLDANDREVAFNDDASASTWDARIVYEVARPAEFKIVVTSFDGKVGKFKVVVIEADKKTPLLKGSRFAGKAIELKLADGKATYAGALDEKDPTVFKRAYKLFTVALEEGKTYRIEGRPTDPKALDAHVIVEDADGTPVASDSVGGAASNPRIDFKAPKAGAYRVIATSTREAQVGRFTLEIGPGEETKKGKK